MVLERQQDDIVRKWYTYPVQKITRSEEGAEVVDGAEVEDVADFARHLPEKWLVCRDTGHVWRPFDAQVLKDKGCYERSHRCFNCKTVRRQHLTFRGAVLRTIYEHPEGYLSDIGRIVGEGRDALRLESLKRAIGGRKLHVLQRKFDEAV